MWTRLWRPLLDDAHETLTAFQTLDQKNVNSFPPQCPNKQLWISPFRKFHISRPILTNEMLMMMIHRSFLHDLYFWNVVYSHCFFCRMWTQKKLTKGISTRNVLWANDCRGAHTCVLKKEVKYLGLSQSLWKVHLTCNSCMIEQDGAKVKVFLFSCSWSQLVCHSSHCNLSR